MSGATPSYGTKTSKRAPPRFVTATNLFDGHDAAINIVRRILQAAGAEVVHLGHNRSVDEIVAAAVQEDVQAVAVSSYQGGHMEFFRYLVDTLRLRGGGNIVVFGGGGGVFTPDEIEELQDYGVARIYTPEDGRRMGLKGMIKDMLECAGGPGNGGVFDLEALGGGDHSNLARVITALEAGAFGEGEIGKIRKLGEGCSVPVLGVTGTGGAGKSSLVDELILRFRRNGNDPAIAVIAIDPSRRKTGGALLGDRLRMNALGEKCFMRSMATRTADSEIPACLPDVISACKAAGFELVIVETPGIGQGDVGIVPYVDVPLYVMTPEFGAASQLEKIDMLDYCDAVAINKFDRKGATDALRDVRKQVQRNRGNLSAGPEEMPVFGTIAARFNDQGLSALFKELLRRFSEKGLGNLQSDLPPIEVRFSEPGSAMVPPDRQTYLGEIARTVRQYRRQADEQAAVARERRQLIEAKRMMEETGQDVNGIGTLISEHEKAIDPRCRALLDEWPRVKAVYEGEKLDESSLRRNTMSGTPVPRVALPRYEDDGEILGWLLRENLPGHFPFTAGVFPFKREEEDPTRMFAGEGDPFRTNKRFRFLSENSKSRRLSTAFDSVTLYGSDPGERPDIYGKVGNSGVSVATLDDMKALYDGFDLCDPLTSVSMTINGPAPAVLAMFLNTAYDQRRDAFEHEHGRPPDEEEWADIRRFIHDNLRGTVQADILKEDQGQNTCIFSIEFALKMMADIQEFFIAEKVRHFYSASISGFHIAEAGANPITQLAFTLANGFTYVEAYLARGMDIDDFAPNLSFFFSNGMDAEYSVMGRVARRIWALAMRERYGTGERSQKLKYHVQTSGRSLHAQEMDSNDIRTTLQALIGVYDNCNSLHTNAYDEAFTTPTEDSLRRALAIQMIIIREWGPARNENPNQGAFVIDELTDLVEEAVLKEFERLSERGGVLGAMETAYQRGKIQEESLLYETRKHDGSLPIVGVNTFVKPGASGDLVARGLSRSSEEERQSQIRRLREFHQRHRDGAPAMLEGLKETASGGGNTFAVLLEAVRCCSLGQITRALFETGGQYRRNM